MELSKVLSEILRREVVYNNGKYYTVNDNGDLAVMSCDEVYELIKMCC